MLVAVGVDQVQHSLGFVEHLELRSPASRLEPGQLRVSRFHHLALDHRQRTDGPHGLHPEFVAGRRDDSELPAGLDVIGKHSRLHSLVAVCGQFVHGNRPLR